jgi:hypothetical protein
MAQSPFFSASCPVFAAACAVNGTVPRNQNLIQKPTAFFHRAGCYGRTPNAPGSLLLPRIQIIRSLKNSQRWPREAIATMGASCAHPLAGVCAGSCRPPLLLRRTHHDEFGVFIFSSLAAFT